MIRKLYWRIKNILWLIKALKEDVEIHNWSNTTYVAFNKYKKSPKWERNLIASFLKKYRSQHPYQIKGWAEYEKLYKEYDNIDGAIKSLEDLGKGDVYVTMFRAESPCKGEKEFQYSSVGTILKEPVVYKVTKFERGYAWLGDNSWHNVTEEWMRAFRYSTEQEIKDYKAEKSRQKKIKKQIKEKQEEITNLYKQL